MRIGPPSVTHQHGRHVLSANISMANNGVKVPESLWFATDGEEPYFLPDVADAFVVGLVASATWIRRDAEDEAPRLIHVGGAGSLEVAPGVLYADKIPNLFLPKGLELEIRGQVLTLEYLRTVTGVKWSYATPAKNFTNGKRTGAFRIGGDALKEDGKTKSKISRADFAVALIDEVEKAEHVGARFSVAY